jgi:hypothetical protein
MATHRGVTKPEKIADSAIEDIYTKLNNGNFWQQVKANTGVTWGWGRKINGHVTFVATSSERLDPDDVEAAAASIPPLQRAAQQQHGIFVASLMAALGNQTWFQTHPAFPIETPGLVSQPYDVTFPAWGAKLLHQQIGMRGQELYNINRMMEFFNPGPYVSGETPNHQDNFMAAYRRVVPADDQLPADTLTQAFSRIAVVAEALRQGNVQDEATARRNFTLAEQTITQATTRLERELPEGVVDVPARSALLKTRELLKAAAGFREARSMGQGVV